MILVPLVLSFYIIKNKMGDGDHKQDLTKAYTAVSRLSRVLFQTASEVMFGKWAVQVMF